MSGSNGDDSENDDDSGNDDELSLLTKVGFVVELEELWSNGSFEGFKFCNGIAQQTLFASHSFCLLKNMCINFYCLFFIFIFLNCLIM